MRTCETCGVEKAESHFRPFGRGRKKVCMACEGRAQGETVLAAQELVPATIDGPRLELARGYGLRAAAENGALVIEQDADDGTATIVLSRTEAKVLFAQFAEWAA